MTVTRRGVLAVSGVVLGGCMVRRAPPPVAPVPDDLSRMLDEGATVPDVTAVGLDGKPVPLARYRGKLAVLYFYPMDFAAGASALADEFKEDHARFRQLGAAVVGISTDEPQTHKQFSERYKLPFPLLSDPGGAVARAFGVPLQAGTATHATFLVDRRGVVLKVWRKVRPWGHAREVLAAVKGLGK
jgi:peroxiredoxin Q/BCP